MPSPEKYTSDLNITLAECVTMHGTTMSYGDELTVKPEEVEEENISGTCVFDSVRHRLIGEIFHLLYTDVIARDERKPKYLTLVVVQDSPTTVNASFGPLEYGAMTKWGATGFWRDEIEENKVYSIMFYDSPDGSVSDRLLSTISELGEDYSPGVTEDGDPRSGEFVQFATIEDIDATTLTAEGTTGSFPSQATKDELDGMFPLPDPTQA